MHTRDKEPVSLSRVIVGPHFRMLFIRESTFQAICRGKSALKIVLENIEKKTEKLKTGSVSKSSVGPGIRIKNVTGMDGTIEHWIRIKTKSETGTEIKETGIEMDRTRNQNRVAGTENVISGKINLPKGRKKSLHLYTSEAVNGS
ncbi:hypothetical protein EVAR_92375_1 [Eumeta japonica]|uniref:Uncharacterized protein n=1 Tax=Eumeta variegata TaxID=151549 RepID=A0A4C1TIR8_EUMVA|nr:hypothetical protein EVAR_92375_1 [Eumeta japonica]